MREDKKRYKKDEYSFLGRLNRAIRYSRFASYHSYPCRDFVIDEAFKKMAYTGNRLSLRTCSNINFNQKMKSCYVETSGHDPTLLPCSDIYFNLYIVRFISSTSNHKRLFIPFYFANNVLMGPKRIHR